MLQALLQFANSVSSCEPSLILCKTHRNLLHDFSSPKTKLRVNRVRSRSSPDFERAYELSILEAM